jgi:hypothetical protein
MISLIAPSYQLLPLFHPFSTAAYSPSFSTGGIGQAGRPIKSRWALKGLHYRRWIQWRSWFVLVMRGGG